MEDSDSLEETLRRQAL
jgi:hypothetical protein